MKKMEYEEAEELIPIAEKVIRDNNMNYIHIDSILFLKVDKTPKSGRCELIGKCSKVQPRYKKILNKDFVIEFTPIFFEKNQETQEMFMYHELLHIEKDNESIRHHDYEEFKERFYVD